MRSFLTVLALIALAAILVAASDVPSKPQSSSQKAKTTSASSSKSCAERISTYLQRAVTQRSVLASRESAARAALNELRSVAAEEKDGQRPPAANKNSQAGDTSKRMQEAMSALESASAALSAFDVQTLQQHGDTPQQCIHELEALRRPVGSDSMMDRYMQWMDLVWLHVRLFARTGRGVVYFIADSYAPTRKEFEQFAHTFRQRARATLDALQKRGVSFAEAEWSARAEMALQYLEASTYALAPYALLSTMGIVALLFAPFMASAVLVPNLLWRVWGQLFFLHHAYGETGDGVLTAAQQLVDLVMQKQWGTLQERLMDILLKLAGNGSNFYNGVIAASLVVGVVWVLLALMYAWVRVPLYLFRTKPESGKRGSERAAKKSSSSGRNTVPSQPTAKNQSQNNNHNNNNSTTRNKKKA